jgi:hypothetical protein
MPEATCITCWHRPPKRSTAGRPTQPDGVEMGAVQAARAHAPAHRAVRHPEPAQLPARDHAVLASRERRDRGIETGLGRIVPAQRP